MSDYNKRIELENQDKWIHENIMKECWHEGHVVCNKCDYQMLDAEYYTTWHRSRYSVSRDMAFKVIQKILMTLGHEIFGKNLLKLYEDHKGKPDYFIYSYILLTPPNILMEFCVRLWKTYHQSKKL